MCEHPQACPEWHGDLAGWLTAQIGPDREAALEAHLSACARCRAEADSLLAVVADSLAAEPGVASSSGVDEGPPAELGGRIAAHIGRERRRRTVRRSVAAALAGAAAAAVLVGALILAGDDAEDPLRGQRFAFTVGRAEAVVAPDDGGSVVGVTATGLDPDITYALWLSVPGGRWDDRVPAGTFRPDDEGSVEARLPSALPPEDTGRVWATTPDGEIALDTQ
ncbi:MAG: hypothetical protein Q8K58_08040 [Acidimicrobiales bacterium]|nr:hypothetical protein [Acidimicrobiales bacterium]